MVSTNNYNCRSNGNINYFYTGISSSAFHIFNILAMKKYQGFLNNLFALALGLIFSFIGLEIFARFISASNYFRIKRPIVCSDKKIVDLDCIPQRYVNGQYTKGKFPPYQINARKTYNDIGQFSNINLKELNEYYPKKVKVLSISDSYVEALQVDNSKSFHGLLNNKKLFKNGNYLSTAIGTQVWHSQII